MAGRAIGEYQLDGVRAAAVPGDRVLVVTGYCADAVHGWLRARAASVPVETVQNARWAELNNWHSLLVAVRRLTEMRWRGGVVVLNSDLCARPAWYASFLRAARRAPAGEAVLAVDLARPLSEEAMKVGAAGPDGRGYCASIGKRDVSDPVGEFVGMAAFAPGDWPRLLPVLENFRGAPEHAHEWYEAAFQRLIDDRLPFRIWPAPDGNWVEIDDPADWRRADGVMAAR